VNCKNCQRQVELSDSLLHMVPRWRHVADQMLTCFFAGGKPIKDESGRYFIAEPEDEA
jgi:hypothetical protein